MFRMFMFVLLFVGSLFAKPFVAVSILPQQYLVEKIAGDAVQAFAMIDSNANHETYEPKPQQMKMIASSDIYFAIGLPFEENWLERFKGAAPKMQIANTDKNVKKIEFSEHHEHDSNHDEHDKEHEEHHDHGKYDPHIWLDPILLKTQAKNIKDVLSVKYPKNALLFEENYLKFQKEMDELDANLSKILKNIGNRSFFVFHPSWGYFAARYDLEQIYVEIEGKEAKGAELVKTLKIAKEKNIKALLAEPQVSQKNAKIIADEVGIKLIKVDPLQKDIAKNLIEFANMLSGI